jgi:hypothetical protein
MNFSTVGVVERGELGQLMLTGISGPEPAGRWTSQPNASLRLALPASVRHHVIIMLDVAAFLAHGKIREQIVDVSINGASVARWVICDPGPRRRIVLVHRDSISPQNEITLNLAIPNCASPKSFGINDDSRLLGVCIGRITWEEAPEVPDPQSLVWQYGRYVGPEARKTFDIKIESGFWSRYAGGPNVLDIGYRGGDRRSLPLFEHAIGVDLDYPGYDGRTLPFADESQDVVFSSHCLEHIPNYIRAIQEWHRVVRIGGHIITVVPNAHLYERKLRPPSSHNADHARFYTPASLLAEFETALSPNSYRVRHLIDNDAGYNYTLDSGRHPVGCYEIELVVQKIAMPAWQLA